MFDFEDALSRAKVKVMMKPNTAFISSVMMSLNCVESERVPTAATNGLKIMFNTQFYENLTAGQRVFLLLHETWHVACDHMGRLTVKDPKIWNMATDYWINNMLIKEGFEFIEGGLADTKYEGWSSDEIYDHLVKNPQDQPNTGYNGEGDLQEAGSSMDGADGSKGSMSQEEKDAAQVKIQEIIARAAMSADMSGDPGSVPADIRRMIEEARNPKLPWHVLLENYMNERVQDEYSWNKRNRRFSHVYLPSLDSEGMGEVRVYVDCSGSISQKELALEVAEMRYIKEVANPSKMVLRAFACSLGREQSFNRDEEIEFDADTSGGTCLDDAWADVKSNPDTEVVVIFTDGYVNVPPLAGMPDIVWVIVNNKDWNGDTSGNRILHMEI